MTRRQQARRLIRSIRALKNYRIEFRPGTLKNNARMWHSKRNKKGVRHATIYEPLTFVPEDFYWHEILHAVLITVGDWDRRCKKDVIQREEELVQDICKVTRNWWFSIP